MVAGWFLERLSLVYASDDVNEKTDLFGMELGYTDNFGLKVGEQDIKKQFNGNIAAVKWGGKRNDVTVENVVQQNSYGYGYDGLNRITEADFYESAAQTPGQKYQLRISEYDRNGNIKQLQRRDAEGVLIDDLVYDYANSGNQLNYVTDLTDSIQGFKDGENPGNDYTYDENGNMTSDANKEIETIKYNYLNLPQEVIFENGDKIIYIYDASGTKLRQEVYEDNSLIKTTDYIGSLIVQNDTLQFIQTAEGRVVPKTVDGVDKNEYQYHLKVHLGNVRSTFAVRDDDWATGFETATHPYFKNYDDITILANQYKRTGNYSHRLSGGGTDIVGLMKTLYVSKGDKVSAEVYGKYLETQYTDDGINGGALISALADMLTNTLLSGEGNTVQNNLNTNFLSAAMADGSEEESPKAYLNYIMLDKNFNYLNSGFERLSESAADPGDGSGTHQKLSFEEIQIEEDGYLMVFLSNESQQTVDVFWDDFKVDHHYNAVLQADDYYPFGLTFNSYQRVTAKENDYLYNGKEIQEEWDVYDYGARYYDPAIARFINVDPLAFERNWLTPYNYVQNNPILRIDPTGALDDYYGIVNDELVYLGSDGQGDNVRLVNEGQHETAQANLNGENTTDAQRETLRSGDVSQTVTFNEGNIQNEFQGANDRTIDNQLENSVIVTLDPATATVDAQPGAEGTSTGVTNTFNTYGSDGMWTEDGSKLVVGVGHGHPTVTEAGKKNGPGYSKGDSETAGNSSAATYSIDSYTTTSGGNATIHQAKPGGKSGQNPVGTTHNTNNIGRRSFIHTAKKRQ